MLLRLRARGAARWRSGRDGMFGSGTLGTRLRRGLRRRRMLREVALLRCYASIRRARGSTFHFA
jgi:hypothetical protein